MRTLLGMLALACGLALAPAHGQLVQVRQDFSRDPGWDHYQNRIVGTDMPRIVQDFGWRRTDYTGSGPGEIGGRVENSRRQAYYAMPLGKPLTFDDEISASGKLALRHIGLRGVGYVGFFNSRRHTWRVWSSMAFRIWEEDDLGQVMFDWMSSDWQARGAETAILLKPDGKVAPLELPLRARGQGRPRLARQGPRAAHHRPHGQRPALRAPGRGAPVRAAEEGGAGPDARGAPRAAAEGPRPGAGRVLPPARDAPLVEAARRREGPRPRHAPVRRRDALRLLVRRGDPASPRPSSTASACSTSPGSARGWRCTWAT